MQLAHALGRGVPLLADGAMATNLYTMGLPIGDPPESWNALFPERVATLHEAFVAAGADLILTNSFGGNGVRLTVNGLAQRSHALNLEAAQLARRVADGAGRPVVVAGCVGPTGQEVGPDGALGEAEAVALFARQAESLAEGGVDMIWIETMSSLPEMRAAVRAAARAGLPYAVTASFDMADRRPARLTAEGFAEAVMDWPSRPAAIGANCGAGVLDVLAAITVLRARTPDIPLVAKASAGLPERRGDHLHYVTTTAAMAAYATQALGSGATIIGGCCGTTPEHLATMRDVLDRHTRTAAHDAHA